MPRDEESVQTCDRCGCRVKRGSYRLCTDCHNDDYERERDRQHSEDYGSRGYDSGTDTNYYKDMGW